MPPQTTHTTRMHLYKYKEPIQTICAFFHSKA